MLDFGPRIAVPEDATEADWYQALFTIEDWNNQLDPFLSQWFRISGELRLTIDWLLAQDYAGHRYVETEFQESVQACEAYHRARFSGLVESTVDFTTRRDRILKPLTGKDRALVKRGLAHANEYSLDQRLRELISEAPVPLAVRSTVGEFVQRVAHTRNVQAHGLTAGGIDHITDSVQLKDAAVLLKWILRVHLLKELGFSRDSIMNIIQRRLESRALLAVGPPTPQIEHDAMTDVVSTVTMFTPKDDGQ